MYLRERSFANKKITTLNQIFREERKGLKELKYEACVLEGIYSKNSAMVMGSSILDPPARDCSHPSPPACLNRSNEVLCVVVVVVAVAVAVVAIAAREYVAVRSSSS